MRNTLPDAFIERNINTLDTFFYAEGEERYGLSQSIRGG